MRISELSSATGVTVPSIKYYLREGLLPQGELTSANQASYADSHVQRLKLIRALIDVGGLAVATAKDVLGAIDDTSLPLTCVFGIAQRAVSDTSLYEPVEGETDGTRQVRETIDRMGWHVSSDNPGIQGAARVIDTYTRVGHPELAQIWEGYAEAAELIARADLATVARNERLEAMAETVVVGTVLGDALVSSLRRMAQEHISNLQFPAPKE
ncbi:MAG: MerR family transcriptional regulator [Salinibacterium sp.]|nr:MerR family transcriptional regulator [Salinibacterium sp.]